MTMTHGTIQNSPLWIKGWFLISSLVVLWDAGYCLSRPHSMEGGKWNAIWRPYNLYGKIDTFYGIEALEAQDGFTSAQAFMNLVETALNFAYLGMITYRPLTKIGQANLVGFTAASLTVAKTVLYWLVELFSGMQHTGHNELRDFILLWVIPNGAWILVPGMIMVALGRDLFARLDQQQDKSKAE
ncbi:related to adiponectin receptor 1 [Lichtheimia corymbifera JMRC:FSU:9682]|uniref:Related to adiponectin receptor 1 n=1 Tax=Lichtheimia corymbifera JMRC:FSU:9682 TaxID=1263082 RepID=A0A068RGS3_9FUNG|nr:related to adiponectin receptor 1 [Lichtheimia corymbifera JMRC:FSU:9682]